jgi:cytochrome P450
MTVTVDDAFIQDPYQLYRKLHTGQPVTRVTMQRGMRAWLVTRYEDARAALSEPSLSKDAGKAAKLYESMQDGSGQEYVEQLSLNMLHSDPPDHTRVRKLATKAFTSTTVERMRPRIQQISDCLLDEMAGHDEVDLLDAYAFPLPITVICELLGVPQDQHGNLRRWSNIALSATEDTKSVIEAVNSINDYMDGLIGEKRITPGADLLSELAVVREDGDRLSQDELIAMAFLLMVAGHETTVNLIGNGVHSLLRNPDQLAALKADPGLIIGAVEEFLRFESPVDFATPRFTTKPLTIGGVEIPEGEFVFVSLAAANRDNDRFPDADRLDVTRKAFGHVAFGHGIHHCVGAPLARLEGQLAIGALLARFPDIALASDEELLWRDSTLLRGLEKLPVRLNG